MTGSGATGTKPPPAAAMVPRSEVSMVPWLAPNTTESAEDSVDMEEGRRGEAAQVIVGRGRRAVGRRGDVDLGHRRGGNHDAG